MAKDVDPSEAHHTLFSPGSLVDHFRVMRLLGRGGMGEVFLARDTKLGRKVALKVIHPEQIGTKEATESFLLEARTMAKFSHPNIVTVYAVGEFEDNPYVALEYLEGQTLRQRMREERPGIRESLRFGLAIGEALREAHAHKILHRDLKPENVLIPKDGRLRVVDFGLAKVLPGKEAHLPDPAQLRTTADSGLVRAYSDAQTQRVSEVRGTPAYMAPEQWMEQEATESTDIWALGIVLYELVAGRSPYQDSTVMELALRVCGPDPVPRLETAQEIPSDLLELIYRCLEKNPQTRPSAAEVSEALEQLLFKDRRRHTEEQCPFRGLLAFSERHADFFFGRDPEIAAFMERMREQPVLPVVGSSGAGKSSFVQAGVIPRLREHGPWIVLHLRPGTEPFLSLASRLISGESTTRSHRLHSFPTLDDLDLSGGGATDDKEAEGGEDEDDEERRLARQLLESPTRLNVLLQQLAEKESCRLLLFVDQLEEIYTLVQEDRVRRAFMQAICSAADDPLDPVRVIFTLRDDFLVRLAEGAEVREALSQVTVIGNPEPTALEETLTKPLETIGYGFDDPELVPEMVAAVKDEPSALPLLQFVTRTIWDQRDRKKRLILRVAYEAAGGVAGALARHADGVLEGLTPDQVRLARDILLKLVTPEGTRKVLSRERVLEGLGESAIAVLGRLTKARLITVRKARADAEGLAELELAHESLIHTWGRLARWIEESREDLSFLAEVSQAAALWDRRGRRETELWEGDALHDAIRALERCTTQVPAQVTRFIEAGHLQERRQSRKKRLRLFASVASVMVLLAAITVAAVIVAWAFSAKERVASQRLAEAQREGAKAALVRGDVLEARAKLRSSLETQDSPLARALWWRLSHEPLVWRKELTSFVYAVAYSPDGRTVAAACQDKSIYLLDVKSQATRVLRGHEDQVFCLDFSPDGRHLASGTWSGKVRVWDLQGGTVKVLGGHTEAVWAVRFHPEGKRLASTSYDRTIRIWDLETGSSPLVLKGHTGRVRDANFSPDGKLLASSAYDNTVRVWDVEAGRLVRTLTGHTNRVYSVAFTPDGKRLVSGSLDRTLRIWDLESGTGDVLMSHAAVIYGVAVSPDGKQVAFGSEKTVEVYDLARGQLVRQLTGHNDRSYSVAFSPDGRRLASACMDKSVRLWDLSSTDRPGVQVGHTSAVFGAAISPDGRTLASGSYDKTIRIWDLATGEERAVLRGHDSVVYNLSFSPDSKHLATCSLDKTIRIWSVARGTIERVLVGHPSGVTDVTYDPTGKRLASVGWDHTVRIWDPAQGTQLRVLKGHTDRVMVVEFSPDGKLLATGGTDKSARVWDLGRGKELRRFEHQGGIYGLTFSPDGKQLASAALDKMVRLWKLADGSGRVVRRVQPRVYWIAFHPDGKRLGAPLSDGTGRIWNLETGAELVLRGHRSEVNVISFSSDGRLVSTSSDDQTLRLWEADSGRPFWRAPILLAEPPQIFSHQGWKRLGSNTPRGWPAAARWREAVERRASFGSEAEDGGVICLQTHDDKLEMWDTKSDRRLFSTEVEGITRVLALPGRSCVTLGQGRVRLYNRRGAFKELRSGVGAVAWDKGEILLAADAEIVAYEPSGAVKGTYKAGVGVTAMARAAGWLALGFSDGNVELVPITADRPKPTFSFEGIPSSSVVRVLEGPMETLIVGYANGFLGIWNLGNGSLLTQIRLHGPVIHMLIKERRLYVATELGNSHVLDLGIFFMSYCELVRSVWRDVPTVWEGGLPVLRPSPEGHICH